MLAVVRIRGPNGTHRKATDTMTALNLHTRHNCVLIPDDDVHRGMLQQVKDFVAFGEVSEDTVADILRSRGQVDGGDLPENLDAFDMDSVEDLASEIVADAEAWSNVKDNGLKLPFRLSPPSKGFKDTRRHYNQGGSLGEREDMDALVQRMI